MTEASDRKSPRRILVMEFATSGGLCGRAEERALVAELWQEGETMRKALSDDLAAAGYEVVGLLAPEHPDYPSPSHRDKTNQLERPERLERLERLEQSPRPSRPAEGIPHSAEVEHRSLQPLKLADDAMDGSSDDVQRLRSAVRGVDATILIAPESGGLLKRLAAAVLEAGGKLLSPGPDFIDLTTDKQRLAEYLGAAGIPVPQGNLILPGQPVRLPIPPPWVVKPRDGAGSIDVTRLDIPPSEPARAEVRLEAYCPGQAVSVAALAGPGGFLLLEPCRQRLRDSLHFEYLGGSLPLPSELRQRAIHLARRTLQSLPETQGYVGMDMVLGARADGEGDVLIEVNPRMTTSYAGLRRAADRNLAREMVEVAWGTSELTELVFAQDELHFLASPQ